MKQEMKITVCFGPTKIIVPCGTQLPVRELIREAVVRYRKVTNKHPDDYIHVHCLQTCDEEAILDEDDTVGDVLDDKDKVIASYEENLGSRPGHNGGDGTSASSVGTASPDIFQGELNACCPIDGIAVLNSVYSDEQHQEMTNECKKPASSMVTYVESFSPNGSHLNLNAMENYAEGVRTSRNRGVLDGKSSGSDFEGYERLNDDNSSDHNNDEDENEVSAFTREPARKSLKSDHLDRWISMQESYSGYERHEPTGAPPSPDYRYTQTESVTGVSRQISLASSETNDAEHINIVLKPTVGEDLGITVQGYKTADERELGLIVFQIDPKGCAARDGRLQVADRIVAVNSQDLTNISNDRAEEAFSKALQCDTIELSISRSHSFIPETKTVLKSLRATSEASSEALKEEEKNTILPLPNVTATTYGKAVSSKNETGETVPRIVEKKIYIDLLKGNDGLGFSVTTRDNPAGGNCPIYVKNILPHGAAIRDGRLMAGDQIIEVNGVEMTGKTQDQAVTILRSTKGQVKLQILRKVTVTSSIGSTKLMKDLKRAPSDSRGNKILTYRIPLPSSGTAGLGITVKGKSSAAEQETGNDRGIFVKTIVPGGAAQQDGRLCPNDQLISVNGVKLTGMSNSSAMKTLRSAMEANMSGSVEVSVIRSVQEILNNVTELETIGQRRNSDGDRAIDVVESRKTSIVRNEAKDLLDGPTSGKKEDEQIRAQMVKDKVDEIAELNSYRKPVKLGNGVHRNQSYYIAMNRSGQRGERHPSSGRSLAKSPFYQPLEEYSTVTEQNVEIARPFNDEKPKIVIASYTDAARVSTPARAFCISSRPTSTVAEPTPSMSTTGPTKSRGSSEAKVEKARDKKSSRQSDATRSKRPPATLPIPKGTPPPPPPRTSRPSPYAKQFPNYLPLNALALRKTDSNFSDSSDGSEISSVLQSPGGSTSEGKILSSAEEETKNGDKSNVLVAEAKIDSKIDDNSDHHADVSADNLTDDESAEEPFLREGFGRQSMSEKRFKLAQADITQTEFYKQRVTRSKSLEGVQQLKVTTVENDSQPKTLPRPSKVSTNEEQRPSTKEGYRERFIGSSKLNKQWNNDGGSVSDISPETSFEVGRIRGQWRTSSDGVVKTFSHRYGNHGKASPLAALRNNNWESNTSHSDGSVGSAEEAIPITMQSKADYNSVHQKVKKKQSPFNFKVLGAALKPKAYRGKYDMQSRVGQESPSEARIEFPDEQRYRQLVLGETKRERSSSETLYRYKIESSDSEDNRTGTRRRKADQGKRASPASLQDFLRKGSGEYSITESAQI